MLHYKCFYATSDSRSRKMKEDVFMRGHLSIFIIVERTSGSSTITLSKRGQLYKTSQYCIPKMGLAVIALITIIITPTILQPILATPTNLPPTNTTTHDDNNSQYNSVTLAPSNQSSTSLPDKTNVTLRGLFTDLGESGR